MNNPLVSIVIPNYNHSRFLDERIQSVLSQTYQNFEVIILDDKSTDNSVEVINKYKDNPHIAQIIVNERNSGSPFIQWNKGFELAKGVLIWIAESDDSCSPVFLEQMVALHVTNDAVFSFCRSQCMDENGRLHRTLHNELDGSFVMSGNVFIEMYLGKYNIVTNASSVLFSKDVAMSVDLQYMNYKGAGDWLFWIELAKKGTVLFCDEALNYYRTHSTSTTQKCYTNGMNYLEGKTILDYLLGDRLISKKTEIRVRKENIRLILHNSFDNEDTQKELLKIWDYNIGIRIKYFCSRVLHKIDSLLWML